MLKLNEHTIDAYQQKVKAQIKETKARMQVLEAQTQTTKAELHLQNQKKLKDWKYRLDDIEVQLVKLSNSTGNAWNDIRTGIDSALSELQGTMDNATEQFKN